MKHGLGATIPTVFAIELRRTLTLSTLTPQKALATLPRGVGGPTMGIGQVMLPLSLTALGRGLRLCPGGSWTRVRRANRTGSTSVALSPVGRP